MSNSSVINTLNVLYDSFAQKEKLVANYVLEHPRDVVNMTSRDLASTCDTSVTTITRLTKKCGVESFHQFKVILARDLVLNDEDVKVSSSISMQDVHGSLLNIQANKIEELKATIALIDDEAITTVIDKIKNSSCVQIVAVGNTIPVAINAEYMFNEIGIRAVSGTIWETQLAFSMTLTDQDVLIAISNTGESKHVLQMIDNAKKKGTFVVGITNNAKSTVATRSDVHLQTATREKLFLNEFYFSRVSAMEIIEILYLFLTVGNETSYKYLSDCENMMADEKL